MSKTKDSTAQSKAQLITPRELMLKYLRFLPWIILSLASFMVLAFLKVRYTKPMYSVTGRLLIKDDANPYSQGGEKFSEIFLMQSMSNNVTDEMEVLNSRTIAKRVVRRLNLQTKYSNKGKIRSSTVYAPDMPFEVIFSNILDSTKEVKIDLSFQDSSRFKINNETRIYYVGEEIKNSDYAFVVRKKSPYARNVSFQSNDFVVQWTPLEESATELVNTLKLIQPNKFGNIINLSYRVDNPHTGVDIINAFMAEYQAAGLEDKRRTADNTLVFIDDQLDTVAISLEGVESNLLSFRESNKIIDPVEQSKLFLNRSSDFASLQMEEEVKLKVVSSLIDYIESENNSRRLVPSTLGFEDPTLLQKIAEFNRLQLARESAVQTMPETNPIVVEFDSSIENIKRDILQSLKTVRQAITVSLNDYRRKSGELNTELLSIPAKERKLLEVRRQQSLMQELFQYLMQKKLETSISAASTNSNIRIVEAAISDSKPVSPKPFQIYGLFFLLGVFLPITFISLKDFLNDKIVSREEIQNSLDIPILGEIGHSTSSEALVVTRNNRNYIAEQFRLVRTNLQYILPQVERPVLMVTSSFSGEGKSFISSNVGAVFAIGGKKTVILEFDIRKPKIIAGLGMPQSGKGITNYLVGSVSLHDIIFPVPNNENLFVIPCGLLPPNPAELLLQEKVANLFSELRKMFDVIIIDTAPVGLVSDAITLGAYADACLYVVRHNYTSKKFLQLIDELYSNQRLPKVSLILNDIDVRSSGYYGYGYGYGYGNGKGGASESYFDDKPARGLSRLFNGKSK